MMLRAVRGSKEYWQNICGDLEAFDAKYGPATFFLTLSCAEFSWIDLKNFLIKMNSDIPNIQNCSINKLCGLDPINFMKFFEKKWKNFLNIVILNPDGPLGNVKHYFWRIEYQARGWY
jgi:hypothetical protein